MTKHSVPRRTVIGGGIGLGAGLATGVVQAQAQTQPQAQQQAPVTANPAIGYLTSMTYDDPQKKDFLTGLRDNGWEGDPSVTPGTGTSRVDIVPGAANGSYDDNDGKQDLNGYVDGFNGNANVKLIVAVGGLPSAFAAQKKSRKPYLVLIGQIPVDFEINGPNFCGGVNLDTPAGNAHRNALLVKTYSSTANPITPKGICLIYNRNSRMWQAERRAWRAHHWPDTQGGAGGNGDNDTTQFAHAFSRASGNPINAKGVVISADPFFGYKRNDLVSAANNSGLFVVYPFKYYGNATPPPTSGKSSWSGPDLENAYYTMGKKAGQLLTAIMAGSSPPFLELDTLDPSEGNF